MDYKVHILEAAIELFKKQGIRNVTMDDIARNLGMSKRTIYEYYANKEDLICDYIKKQSEKHREINITILKNTSNVMELLFYFLKKDCMDENRTQLNNIIEIKRYYPKIFASEIMPYLDCRVDTLKEILEKGQDEGVVRKDINVGLISKIFTTQMDDFVNRHFENDDYELEEVFKAVFINFMRGISTLKGYEIIDRLLLKTDNYN